MSYLSSNSKELPGRTLTSVATAADLVALGALERLAKALVALSAADASGDLVAVTTLGLAVSFLTVTARTSVVGTAFGGGSSVLAAGDGAGGSWRGDDRLIGLARESSAGPNEAGLAVGVVLVVVGVRDAAVQRCVPMPFVSANLVGTEYERDLGKQMVKRVLGEERCTHGVVLLGTTPPAIILTH